MNKRNRKKNIIVGSKNPLPLEERPDEEIIFRYNLLRGVLKMLKTDPAVKDKAWVGSSIIHYRGQLKVLTDELKRRAILKPVTVDLKPVEIKTKIPGFGGSQ